MNSYLEMKERHMKDVENFPMFFAFNNEQFKEGMKKIGLEPTDTDKVCRIPAGGIIKKEDFNRFMEMINDHLDEKKKAQDNDLDGTGYILEMFAYELDNHEYGYTGDITDTLIALGITQEDLDSNENLRMGVKNAGGVY